MVMQALVNSYGSNFMAGFNGANKIDSFAFMPIQSFATAMTTYTGQNIGAGLSDRVKSGTRAGFILSAATSVAIGAILFPLSGLLMQMFNKNPDVIAAGECYLYSVLPFYILLASLFIFNSVLRGAGEMFVPVLSTLISLWLARVPVAYLIASLWGRDYIYFSYAVGWAMGTALSYGYYRTGRWKNKSLISGTN